MYSQKSNSLSEVCLSDSGSLIGSAETSGSLNSELPVKALAKASFTSIRVSSALSGLEILASRLVIIVSVAARFVNE